MTRHTKPIEDEPSGNAHILADRFDAIDRSLASLVASGERYPGVANPLRLASWREKHEAILKDVQNAHAALDAPLNYKPPKHSKRLIEVGKAEETILLEWLVEGTTHRQYRHRRMETHAANNPLQLDAADVMAIWMRHMPERVVSHNAGVAAYRAQQRERERLQRQQAKNEQTAGDGGEVAR